MNSSEQVKFFADVAFNYSELVTGLWTVHATVNLGAAGFALASRSPHHWGVGAGWCLLLWGLLLVFDALSLATLTEVYARLTSAVVLMKHAWARAGENAADVAHLLPGAGFINLEMLGLRAPRHVVFGAGLDVVTATASALLLSPLGRRRAYA